MLQSSTGLKLLQEDLEEVSRRKTLKNQKAFQIPDVKNLALDSKHQWMDVFKNRKCTAPHTTPTTPDWFLIKLVNPMYPSTHKKCVNSKSANLMVPKKLSYDIA